MRTPASADGIRFPSQERASASATEKSARAEVAAVGDAFGRSFGHGPTTAGSLPGNRETFLFLGGGAAQCFCHPFDGLRAVRIGGSKFGVLFEIRQRLL